MSTATPSPAAAATCRCGHTQTHPLVHLVPSYGPFAWIWLMAGATAIPKKAQYVCRRCGQSLGETRDPALLRSLR